MYHTLDTQKSIKPLFGHPVSKYWLRPCPPPPIMILLLLMANSHLPSPFPSPSCFFSCEADFLMRHHFSLKILRRLCTTRKQSALISSFTWFYLKLDTVNPYAAWWRICPIQNDAKSWEITEPWHMGIYLRVLNESYPMNTNMMNESSLSIGRINSYAGGG